MNVRECIELLKTYPEDMPIMQLADEFGTYWPLKKFEIRVVYPNPDQSRSVTGGGHIDRRDHEDPQPNEIKVLVP